ncbi:MAG: DNA mismatch repair endonuclease MutL [Leptospiraceae bacterium]|nr:DNA mismatch repair endonuclease MutL [Leptospiraceae bacterium]MDW7975035.1 DNA mismatch repair endonuclease MutL [Leptospiraceae bacterium]
MGLIRRLDPVVIHKIAAGEVIERPASVVKELVENSLDAKATKIEVYTYNGGIDKIIVKDNGEGILKEDLPLTIEKHTTSKIYSLSDLESLTSFGFRGEALHSISAVSLLEIQTKHISETIGTHMIAREGNILSLKPVSCLTGTSISVIDLFFSTPARKKFLKKPAFEDQKIFREIMKFTLSHPHVEFQYFRDDKPIMSLPSMNFYDLTKRIELLLGKGFADKLLPVFYEKEKIKVQGWIGKANLQNSLSEYQFVFVNQRAVEIKNLSSIIKKAYGPLLPTESKPIYFLFFEIPPFLIDVNVHPTKKEIRIQNEQEFYTFTIDAIKRTLLPNVPLNLDSSPKFTEKNFGTSHSSQIQPMIFSEAKTFYMEKTKNLEIPKQHQPEFPERILGVIFGTYILAASQNELFFIDQHTAHERINYEKKRKQILKNIHQKQILLYPIHFRLTNEEKELMKEFEEELQQLGFSWEFFSDNTLVLREIPDFLELEEEKEQFIQIIKNLSLGYNKIELYDSFIANKACKASIRKNDPISLEAISEMLMKLYQCEVPSRCPHGRPTIIRIDKSEIDRWFYRKETY